MAQSLLKNKYWITAEKFKTQVY